jgi:hypothetical protein
MQVAECQIDVTLPANSVTMLIAQPFLEFLEPLQEPFPLSDACGARLLQAIDKVFEVARLSRPHFILFPEFSIPGLAGVQKLFEHLLNPAVSSPAVVIAGISGLRPNEYEQICNLPQMTPPENEIAPISVPNGEWVNTSITFVKSDDGTVSAFVQPKISPSWAELNTHHGSMFKGSIVRVFRARFNNHVACRFFSLLCFDWVGHDNGEVILSALLNQLNANYGNDGSQQSIQWAFVLQHNPNPNHYTFLNSANAFLTQVAEHPFVLRNHAAVVMASTACSKNPVRTGPHHGFCSLIFSPVAPFETKGCLPTFATQSSRLRGTASLGTCKDALFREMGECIHEAEVRVPNFITVDPTDRTPPFAQAKAYPFSGGVVDARIPGEPVPAVIKWANDELDGVPDLSVHYFVGNPLQPLLRDAQDMVVSGYRRLSSQDLAFRIDGACASHADKSKFSGDPAAYVDAKWDAEEHNGLCHVVQTLTLVGSVSNLNVPHSHLHARCDSTGIEITAVIGPTHAECVNALRRLMERTHAPIVLVTRDDNNVRHLPKEFESFTNPRSGAGVKFTDSQTLLDAARGKSVPDYTTFITELLDVPDRRII